jgi:hypothetical protein
MQCLRDGSILQRPALSSKEEAIAHYKACPAGAKHEWGAASSFTPPLSE